MFKPIIIALLISCTSIKANAQTFLKEEQRAQPVDYRVPIRFSVTTIVQFQKNDTARFIYYTTNSTDKNQSLTREEYVGLFRKVNDTLSVDFIYVLQGVKNRFGLIKSTVSQIPFDKNFQHCLFLVKENSLIGINNKWVTTLKESDEMRLTEMEVKYKLWDKCACSILCQN